MPENEDTYARLIHFFTERPTRIDTIVAEPSQVEVWEEIFFFFFGEKPIDNQHQSHPAYWRPGSTDPRWDILLYKENMGAMHALDKLIAEMRNGIVLISSHREAA